MENTIKTILIVLTVSLAVLLTFGLNNSASSQASAFCAYEFCPGGCAITGFDTGYCFSTGCICMCIATFDAEYINLVTDCTGLGMK